MTPKERIQATLDRQPTDRAPVDLWYTPEVAADLMRHFGVEDEAALFDALGLDRIIWLNVPYTEAAGQPGTEDAAATGQRTLWGTPLKMVQSGAAQYHEYGTPPLQGYDDPAALDDYPYWPDPDRFDYDAGLAQAQQWSPQYATMGPWVAFFEVYCQMRGLEQALMDLALAPELVDAVLDRIEATQTEMMRRFYDRAADHVTLAFFSDDMGAQESLLLSPALWDRFFRDRLARWCDLAHGYGLKVLYHSDGAMEPLISRLIDAGVDVLNPVQHVCPGMDRRRLKQRYGDRLLFHGGVENQAVLPFGSADDVRAETRACLETLGAGGGYIACSCHNVQPGTPVENILAMIETVQASSS